MEYFFIKDPVRLLPCDHTSDDQLVEFGLADVLPNQLVSFSHLLDLHFNSGQVPVNIAFWEARTKQAREMELKLAKVRI